MLINLDKLLAAIVPVLKRHPDALVAIVMLAIGMAAAAANLSLLVSLGLPVALFTLYILRMSMLGRHEERMAKLAIEKLEITKGVPTRERAHRALERRKGGN